MQNRTRNDSSRTTMICVDTYEQSILTGRFYNLGQEDDGQEFRSLIQLLSGIEQTLDSVNFPQSFTAVRSFGSASAPRLTDTAENKTKKGALATFVVKVLFRQHTSWQGSVTWLDKNVEQPFRSVLELVLLMDSALSSKE